MKNYTNDKIQYGVPIRRSETKAAEKDLGSLQSQAIDINMDYRPYRTSGRLSLGSIEDMQQMQRSNAATSQYLSDFTGSEYSSDAESGRFSVGPQTTNPYDAQRTSAF